MWCVLATTEVSVLTLPIMACLHPQASLRRCLLAALQFLANLTAGNAATCASLWEVGV
jgi:hypothetical protein